MERREITIEDFYDMFWGDYVSKYIVTDEFLIDNQEFINEITYDYFRIYQNSDIDINILVRILESMFKNLRIYQPNVKI